MSDKWYPQFSPEELDAYDRMLGEQLLAKYGDNPETAFSKIAMDKGIPERFSSLSMGKIPSYVFKNVGEETVKRQPYGISYKRGEAYPLPIAHENLIVVDPAVSPGQQLVTMSHELEHAREQMNSLKPKQAGPSTSNLSQHFSTDTIGQAFPYEKREADRLREELMRTNPWLFNR